MEHPTGFVCVLKEGLLDDDALAPLLESDGVAFFQMTSL